MNQAPKYTRQAARAKRFLVLGAVWTAWVLGPLVVAAPNPAKSTAPGTPAQVARDGWKDCSFNGVAIGCIDQQLPDGISLLWKDGLKMTYHQLQAPQAGRTTELRDQLGGVWRRQILGQGNTVLTNGSNGARIFVPLRFTCKPPLQGEVGYCHY